MDLASYLDRIGFRGRAAPDLGTLRAIAPLHLKAFPFENLDVQLGRRVTVDVAAAFEKLVERRRGGWCFEQNGVLGWALAQIGFRVTRASGGVMRSARGDGQLGNHLCLIVHSERDWLVDGGFGGSLSGPLALQEGERRDGPYRVGLQRLDGGYWRYWEAEGEGDPFSFDFRAESADERRFAAKCEELQTDPASPFVQNVVVQRRVGDVHHSLRGRVLVTTGEAEKRIVASSDEFVAVLREIFGLDVPDAARLWPAICARHEAVMAGRT